MKLLSYILGSFNGKFYFKLGENNLLTLEYITPNYNDYNEWKVSIFYEKNVNTDLILNKINFDLDFSNLNDNELINHLNKLINNIEENNFIYYIDDDNIFNYEDVLTYVNYRKPTYEEMKEQGNFNLDDYNIGGFIYLEDKGNKLIHLNDFKPDNILLEVCFVFLLKMLEKKEEIYSSEISLFL